MVNLGWSRSRCAPRSPSCCPACQISTWRCCDVRCSSAELARSSFSALWRASSSPSSSRCPDTATGRWCCVRSRPHSVVAFGVWLACGWRPGLPVFDSEVKSMVRFGLHVVGFSVAYTLARAVDRIALGLFYRPDQVGYYQNAVNLYENSIYSALIQMHAVGSSALSKLQSNPAALRQKYEAALSMLAFFVMPMAAILSVTAEDLTVILLGEKWRVAGSLLSIIALRGIFNVVEGSQGWLHLSIGQSGSLAELGYRLARVSRSWRFSQACRLAPGESPSQRSWPACSSPCRRSSMPAARSASAPRSSSAPSGPQFDRRDQHGGCWAGGCRPRCSRDYSGLVRIVLSGGFLQPVFTLPLLSACFGLTSRLGSRARS